jgi:plasmid stabilization system protein ParE
MSKRYRIEWAPAAQADVDEILRYIAERDSVDAAVQVYDKLIEKIESLRAHPTRCRIPPELERFGVEEYRELLDSPFSIFFRIAGSSIRIIGVLDRRRDLEEVLIRRALR